MPKEMFSHIPLEKQKMFLNVAIEEFTTKSFELVSVNSIVKNAGISRGSFYTYFEDKEELFNFIFNQTREERLEYAKIVIKESNRDFFVFIKTMFVYDFENFFNNSRFSLFRNYIHYLQVNKKGSIRDSIIMPLSSDDDNAKNEYSTTFDISEYNMNEDEFLDLVEMTIVIVINTFLKSESENLSKNEIIKIFNNRIEILKRGSRRREI